MQKLILVPFVLVGLTGCAGFAFMGQRTPVAGIYASANTPQMATDNNIGKKKGEACASSILGIVTTGDAGIRAAADAGGITQISAVDSVYTNILGIYAKYCTMVSGTDGAGKADENPEHP